VKFLRVAVAVPLALLMLAACGQRGPKASAGPSWVTPSGAGPARFTGDATRLAAAMSDADLAGQVLMPYAFGGSATAVDKSSAVGNRSLAGVDTPAEMIRKFHLGGMILVGFTPGDPTGQTNPTTNVDSPAQVRALTAGLQSAAGPVPLLIGTDQEFGVVTRIKTGVTALPAAMAFGAAGKPALTEAAWRAAGTELAAMGINVDFAPVADTLGAAGNPAIGSRAFGGNAKANAAQVAAAVRGIEGAGVLAAVKHFPGHGHTTGDSHDELPVVTQSRSAWESQDLPPFRSGIAAGASMVMSGHLDVRALDPGVPASFSHKVMTDELRGRLKFTGVAVTDAMNMSPAMKWSPGEAAVRALAAGNDLLLMPPDIAKARDGILAGLQDGSLPRGRLVQAVTRILTLKLRITSGKPQPALSTLSSAEHQRAVLAADQAAITVVKGRCAGPLVTGPVTVTAAKGRETARSALARELQSAGVPVRPTGAPAIHLVGYGDQPTDLDPAARVTVMMDAPGLLAQAKSATLIATYSSSPLAMAALAQVLSGKSEAPGRSPVPIAGLPRSAC
jgi:beta-N-acetylhexosaminidase